MPHCLGEIVVHPPHLGSHAFVGIYYYYFKKEKMETGWMEVSGSAVHLCASGIQTSGVLKIDGKIWDRDLKSSNFQSDIPEG